MCTGRLFSGTRHVAEELELEGPVACVDGSHIVDVPSGLALHLRLIDASSLAAALRTLEKAELQTFVFAGDAVHYERAAAPLLDYVSLWSADCHESDSVTNANRWGEHDRVTTLVAMGPSAAVQKAGIVLGRMSSLQCAWFEVRRRGYEGYWGLVVRSSGASKGTAVKWLADHYRVERSEVIVVGDWLNDVPMFEWAEHAFAMAQAPDAVKAAASVVLDAGTHEGGGIHEAARRMGWL